MKTDAVTPADLAASVIAVPPLARVRNGAAVDRREPKIVDWLARRRRLDLHVWRQRQFLQSRPARISADPRGPQRHRAEGELGHPVDRRRFRQGARPGRDPPKSSISRPRWRCRWRAPRARPASPPASGASPTPTGKPIIAYVRAENYIAPRDLAALIADGAVCALKYAVERKDPGGGPLPRRNRRSGRRRSGSSAASASGRRSSTSPGSASPGFTSGSVSHRAASVDGHPRRAEGRRRRRRGGAPREIPAPSRTSATPTRRSSSSTMACASPASPTPGRCSPSSPISARIGAGGRRPRRGRSTTRTPLRAPPGRLNPGSIS